MLARVKSLYLLPLALCLSFVAGCSDDEPAVTATDSGDFGDGPITTRPDDGVDTGTAVTDTGTAAETSGETGDETGGETGSETGADSATDGG